MYPQEPAKQVVAWENDKPIDWLASAEAERVETTLHRHYLPKMDSDGSVEYDSV